MNYHHLAHLLKFDNIRVGQRIKRGQLIGYCGKSGTGSPHCHYEIMVNKPGRWTEYTWGMTKAQVKAKYLDPTPFLVDNLPMKWNKLGYDYLSPISSGKLKGYHPGKDLNFGNGSDDLGMAIHAPVDGVIEYIGLNPKDGDWGNHVWIREEANPGMKYDNYLIQETEKSGSFALVYGDEKHLVLESRAGLASLTVLARGMKYAPLTLEEFNLIPTGDNF